ncbi:hypothetical protein Hanom_Chr12g01153801 [Helianthus anomalus]
MDDESMKQDYIEHIMTYKKYKAKKHQYKEWTISELKEEIARIQEMLDKKIKQTPQVWSKYKKNVPEKVLMLKRMKEELIVANYGSRNQVTRWTEVKVFETYKRLEERRKKDPTAPQKQDYPKVVFQSNRPYQSKYMFNPLSQLLLSFIKGKSKNIRMKKKGHNMLIS